MNKILCIGMIAIFAILLFGCATLFNDRDPAVTFMSDPSAAKIYVNGAYMGDTPAAIELMANRTHTIEFKKDGYETKIYLLNNKVGAGWIVLDVLSGLIPVVIDAATGSWYEFTEENVMVVLQQ